MIQLFKESRGITAKQKETIFSFYQSYFHLKEDSMHMKWVQMHKSSKKPQVIGMETVG